MTANNQSLTKSVIENILIEVAKSKNIDSYELKPNVEVQVGDGFSGQFYTGEIINKSSSEITTVAIKKTANFEFDFSAIFKNEVTFYTSVFPVLMTLQKEIYRPEPFDNVPELFCYSLEPKKEYLAMDNLKTKGYVLYDKKKYLDKEHLELIFKLYGKFHALSFILRKRNFELYQKIHQGYTDLFYMMIDYAGKQLEDCFAAAVDALDPKSAVYEEAKDFPKNMKLTFLDVATYTGQYRCLTHGDCWSNNMLFKYSENGKLEDIKLIDFQLARDSSPIHDLSYFFYSGACKNDLDDLENYLKIYHNSLSEVIRKFGEDPDDIFSYDTLIKEWKDNALLGLFYAVYLWQIKLLPKEEIVDAFSNNIKSETVDERMRCFNELVSKRLKSDDYKERTSALLIHAYEFGVLRKEKLVKKDERRSISENVH